MPWWQYQSIIENNRIETANYYRLPPDACEACGTPLEVGQITVAGGGKEIHRKCPMGGPPHTDWTGGERSI